MKVIGLGHYSRTGKDTLGAMLQEELKALAPQCNVIKTSFAYKLKDICHQLYAWDGLREAEFYETVEGALCRDIPLPTIGKTPVQIWVEMGTPAIREQVYDKTWIDYVLRSQYKVAPTGQSFLIITDVRFLNEVEALRQCDSFLIKTVRGGIGPRNTVADLALYGWDGWNYVAGTTITNLRQDARVIAEGLLGSCPYSNFQTLAERASRLELEGAIGQTLVSKA